jgi:hypothetical protein
VAAFCAGPWTVRERLWRAGVVGDSASQPASGYRPSSTADSDLNKRYGKPCGGEEQEVLRGVTGYFNFKTNINK